MSTWLKLQFEYRIFISLFIAIGVYICSLLVTPDESVMLVAVGTRAGLSSAEALSAGYIFLAFCMLNISRLRMWAGTILSSATVMSFKVQTTALRTEGPYQLVRNPIYLSDLLAMTCFALCMTWVGIFLPVLFYLHYRRLIIYEEISFGLTDTAEYANYRNRTPRLLPNIDSLVRFYRAHAAVRISTDGFMHNALYLLFVPGFLIGAWQGRFLYVLFCGFPAVVHWAIIHTKIGLQKSDIPGIKSSSGKKIFSEILYAQCWEDPDSDRSAFKIKADDVIFSITSGGCNVLSFLIDNPRKVIALDLNPAQSFLLDLKIAAFRKLDHDHLLAFIGITPGINRLQTYQQLRAYLAPASRDFWDARTNKIQKGIIHSGRYEMYMRILRRLLHVLIGKSVIERLFKTGDAAERAELFDERWNNLRWKLFTRLLLSRQMMSLFFDKSFFTYLEKSFSFGAHFAGKAEKAIKDLPVRQNNFLAYILLGNYPDPSLLPRYLQKENYTLIRQRLDRIKLVTGNCMDFLNSLPDDHISQFNYSNIFEWMSEADCEKIFRETIRVARDGAILTYRNLLVPRRHPHSLDRQIQSMENKAESIFKRDLSFIYNHFVVEKINKEKQRWPITSNSFPIAVI